MERIMEQYISIRDENDENRIVLKSSVDLTNYEQNGTVFDNADEIERWEYQAS
jgi:hypothetical protein